MSTFNVTINALRSELDSSMIHGSDSEYVYEYLLGIKCNTKQKFNSMKRVIESHILNIILSFEIFEGSLKIKPIAGWNDKIKEEDKYMYESYVKILLNKSVLCQHMNKLESNINTIYPDQIFRHKLKYSK